MKTIRKLALGAGLLTLALGASVPSQAAVTFNFTYVSGTSAQAITAFEAAGAYWASLFTDNVTLNMNVGTAALGAGILGQAGSSSALYTYADVRAALAGDVSSSSDAQAVSSLATGSGMGMLINRTTDNPNGANSSTPFLDTTGANTTSIRMNTANAKALGLTTTAASDASITFSTGFTYDFDRSDGITAGTYDFYGLAVHEIGHALGFTSGVDVLAGNSSGFSSNAFTYVTVLDLFRYSAASSALGVHDFTFDNRDKYFSLDNGVTVGALFSNGQGSADNRQASHWKDGLGLGIMDPTAASGELLAVSANDILAFDAIGWNLAAVAPSVPEPASWAMMLGGFGLIGAGMRRRKMVVSFA